MKLFKQILLFCLLTFNVDINLTALTNQPNTFNGIITNTDYKLTGGGPIEGAVVYLVSTDLVNKTPITGTTIYNLSARTHDEPIEDIIRRNDSRLLKSEASKPDGLFSIRAVNIQDDKKYFVYVLPGNTKFLPGGNKSRKSYSKADLLNNTLTIFLSSKPPVNAAYTGSSRCLNCHDSKKHPSWHFQKTGHKLAWSVPSKVAVGQDFSGFPNWFRGLGAWKKVDYKPYDSEYSDLPKATVLELGDPKDLDDSEGSSKFKVRIKGDSRLPIKKVYAEFYLWRNHEKEEKHYITIVNMINPNDPNSPLHLPLELVYGGGVHRQRFIVSVPKQLAERQGHYTLLQYNPDGEDIRLNHNRRVWRDYKFSHWWGKGVDNEFGTSNDVLVPPKINVNTIEAECAGCHVTGAKRTKDPTTGQFLISGVRDIEGAFDLDRDGFLEEVNVGCESCHGPGSKHVSLPFVSTSSKYRGPYYSVNPANLTAARSDVICGRCHDRRVGAGELAKTQAIDKNNQFLLPGESRKKLIDEFSDPRSPGPEPRKDLWPDDIHSKSPRQQYAEHIKSRHYVNERELVSCASCHDAHGATQYSSWLKGNPNDPTSQLCLSCHDTKLNDHLKKVKHPVLKSSIISCIECHMVGTSKPGGDAGNRGLYAKFPPFTNAKEEDNSLYWQGNLNSHVFDVPTITNIGVKGVQPNKAMPIPYTNKCGTCHDVTTLPTQ